MGSFVLHGLHEGPSLSIPVWSPIPLLSIAMMGEDMMRICN